MSASRAAARPAGDRSTPTCRVSELEQQVRAVYRQLHDIVSECFAGGASGTVSPSALVSEVWRRSRPPDGADDGRRDFSRFAAAIVREVLVDQARERSTIDPGNVTGSVILVLGDDIHRLDHERLLDLDFHLTTLARSNARAVEVVVLHGFGGLPLPEIPLLLRVAPALVERDWDEVRTGLERILR